jgi:protein CpxP
MQNILKASAALAASAAVLTFACAALGQDQPTAPRQPPTAEQRAQWREQRQTEHAQRLTALLNLRPDQQPALQALMAAMAPGEHERRAGDAEAQLTTPQRLDRMADHMARREAEFHKRADAIRTFYAALSPEQQKAFDALPMLMGEGDRERGGHDRRHGDHEGDHDGGHDGGPPAAAS